MGLGLGLGSGSGLRFRVRVGGVCLSASSMTPGTKVFCGEPLMYMEPSSTEATAKMVEGEISGSLSSMACSK